MAVALFTVALVWAWLPFAVSVAAPFGPEPALAFAFGMPALILLRTDGGFAAPCRWGTLAWAALAGWLSLPAWVAGVVALGGALELPPREPSPPRTGGAWWVLATACFAPIFEELLYRGRLLGALRRRTGSGVAVLLSAAAFAMAHLEPWSMLAAGAVGLALGVARCLGATLAVCIVLHGALNLAAWFCGTPPVAAALPPGAAALASLTAAALALRRGSR